MFAKADVMPLCIKSWGRNPASTVKHRRLLWNGAWLAVAGFGQDAKTSRRVCGPPETLGISAEVHTSRRGCDLVLSTHDYGIEFAGLLDDALLS